MPNKLLPVSLLADRSASRSMTDRPLLGTADNQGNTEIMENVIFVKCRDFAKMPCFAVFFAKRHSFTFSQEYFVFNQHNLKFIV